jgi:hypothetical protein
MRQPTLIAAMLLMLYGMCATLRGSDVVQIRVDESAAVGKVSEGFLGFGYETSAVAQTDYFTSKNRRLVRLYTNLGRSGLIRIGGNVSDHTKFMPDAPPAPKTEREVTIINRQNLTDLGDFARATGWQVMWGLNLGTGSREEAVEEAVAVQEALGDRLHSFEIGNEVDLMRKFGRDYNAYHAVFLEYKQALRARLPRAAFSGPDVAGNVSYIEKFVATESSDLKLVTHHYYRTGVRSPSATIDYLLARDAAFDLRLQKLRDLCEPRRLSFRINEVNSFYGGGKAGVSDTFASALWCLDYVFNVAGHGGSGVNMETDINQLGFISHYSPIVHDPQGVCTARPEYYAMLAFAMAGHGELLKVEMAKPEPLNFTGYATRNAQGVIWLTLINKDLAADATVECRLPASSHRAEAFEIHAPSADAKQGITFAGAAVAGDASWSAGKSEAVAVENGAINYRIPRATATIIKLSK